jgi:hypothetical protein
LTLTSPISARSPWSTTASVLTVAIEPVWEGSATGSADAVCIAGANFETATSFSASAL